MAKFLFIARRKLMLCLMAVVSVFSIGLVAQAPVVTQQLEMLIGGLGPVDDLVTLPDGRLAITRVGPLLRIDVFDPATSTLVTVDPGPVQAFCMTLSDDGDALYYGDALTGLVYRLDITTTPPTRTVAVNGLNGPVDILTEGPNRLWIADHVGPNFPFDTCVLYRVDLAGGIATSLTPVLGSLAGAPDMDFDSTGQFIVMTTLASPLVRVVQVSTETVVGILAFPNLVTAADIARLPSGDFLVTTGAGQQVLLLDIQAQTLLPMATNYSINGIGGEDIAILTDGNVGLTTLGGEIWRLDQTSALRQFGDAAPGSFMGLDLHLPAFPNENYALAFAGSAFVGIPVASVLFPLDNDPILAFSLTRPPELFFFDGLLDADGFGRGIIAIPNIMTLTGFQLFFGGLIFNPQNMSPISAATQALRVTFR